MNSTDIETMLRRMDIADKRMEHLQKQIDDLKQRDMRCFESICTLQKGLAELTASYAAALRANT